MSAAQTALRPETAPSPARLSHLKRLEAEAIHIFRETVAETENPVMLYSIGKDSSVMLRLAMKAFAPGIEAEGDEPPKLRWAHVDIAGVMEVSVH